MSKPRITHEDSLNGALQEVIAAQSSLNMYPETIPGTTKEAYLSKSDVHAEHAYEHLKAAAIELHAAQKERTYTGTSLKMLCEALGWQGGTIHQVIETVKKQREALNAARTVIQKMDSDLTNMGKGQNLSAVPGFEGQNFCDFLESII